MNFETVAVPFKTAGNRQFLSEEQIANFPWLYEFIKLFQHCFEYDHNRQIFIYEPPDDT